MKIQFELRPLVNDESAEEQYPEEATKCSSLALHTLLYLVGQLEEKRNACTILFDRPIALLSL